MSLFNKDGQANVCDTYETPERALNMALEHLHPTKHVLWEPFPGTGRSSKYMRKLGFEVWENDHDDFFQQSFPPEKIGSKVVFLVSNPPFSIKQKIFEHLHDKGWTRFLLFLPVSTYFTVYFRNLFKHNPPSIIVHSGGCAFIKPDEDKPMKTRAAFYTGWFCMGLSPSHCISFPSDALFEGEPPSWYEDKKKGQSETKTTTST